MAKRKTIWTEEKIARFKNEGRGSGELSNYKPWITNQDFPSQGRTHRVIGWKTNRMYQLFSDIERNYAYLLDWADNVVDVREQFPLDREKTYKIAESKNIKHPIDSTTNTPLVLTTDFFITIREEEKIRFIARTIKPSSELNKERVIEKFEIEREYWENLNVDWGIVTEKDIPENLWKNIDFLHKKYEISDEEYDFAELLYNDLSSYNGKILGFLNAFDKNYNVEVGTGLTIFKFLLARKFIKLDMMENISLRQSTEVLTFKGFNKIESNLA